MIPENFWRQVKCGEYIGHHYLYVINTDTNLECDLMLCWGGGQNGSKAKWRVQHYWLIHLPPLKFHKWLTTDRLSDIKMWKCFKKFKLVPFSWTITSIAPEADVRLRIAQILPATRTLLQTSLRYSYRLIASEYCRNYFIPIDSVRKAVNALPSAALELYNISQKEFSLSGLKQAFDNIN